MKMTDFTTIRVDTKLHFWGNIGGLLRNSNYKNVSIICGDGVKVETNAMLLASISPWICQLLVEQSEKDHITLITPDVDSRHVQPILSAINDNFQTGSRDGGSKTFEFWPYFMFQPNIKQEGNCVSDTNDKYSLDLVGDVNSELKNFNDDNLGVSANDDDEDQKVVVTEIKNRKKKKNIKNEGNCVSDTNDKYSLDFVVDVKSELKNFNDDNLNVIDEDQKVVVTEIKNKKKKKKLRQKQSRECHICHKVSSSQETWRYHFKRFHPPDYEEFLRQKKIKILKQSRECHICHEVSSSQETWRYHFKRIHPSEYEEFLKKPATKLCTDCGREFENIDPRNKNKYGEHMRMHKLEKYNCECNLTFKTLSQKDRHIRVIHMGWSQCPQCTDTFRSKELLEKHVGKIHNEKIVCEVCGAEACNAPSLRYHMMRMHDPTLVQCKECSKVVEGNYKLEIHVKRVHSNRQLELCKICGDTFAHLRRHMLNVHQNVKNFQCDKCEKGFVAKSLLEKHNMSIHIKSRPYGCRYGNGCTMAYNDISNRNTHEKKKHRTRYSAVNTSV